MMWCAQGVTPFLILLLLCASVQLSGSSNDWESHLIGTGEIFMSAKDPCKPEQVHLSFGDSVHEINIVWATRERCLSKVQYATHPWGFESVVTGEYVFFKDLNERGMQHHYRVKLQNLLPETEYYYIPTSNGSTAGPFYFQTLKSGNDWSPNFLMFGDLGIHTDTIPSLIDEALSGKYAAMFHVGDMAYDMRNEGGLLGDYFMNRIQPVASTIPYMTCPGNHEIDSNTFNHYRHRFAMPKSRWPIPVHKMWYSIDIGPVHFVSYSSEVFFTLDGYYANTQKRWLETDLHAANNNRNNTPWIVAFGHRPMYCSSRTRTPQHDCEKAESRVRHGLEEIFHSYSVDLIIQAHEHNYERFWPMYRDKVVKHSYENPGVPVQIITGAAGNVEGTDFFRGIHPEWSAFRLDEKSLNSYGRLLVVNHTHLLWEQRTIHDHQFVDSIWITQEFRKTDKAHGSSYTNVALFILGTAVILLSIFGIRMLFKWQKKKRLISSYGKNENSEFSIVQGLTDADSAFEM